MLDVARVGDLAAAGGVEGRALELRLEAVEAPLGLAVLGLSVADVLADDVEVRRSRHQALDPIRAQELDLNAQERAWRSDQRDERLREKQSPQERQP